MSESFSLFGEHFLWCMTAIDREASDTISSYCEEHRIGWIQIAGSDPGGDWPPPRTVVLLLPDEWICNSLRLLHESSFTGPVVIWRRAVTSFPIILSSLDQERLDHLKWVDVPDSRIEYLLRVLTALFLHSEHWDDIYHFSLRNGTEFLRYFAPDDQVLFLD